MPASVDAPRCVVWMDGRSRPPTEATISVFDRGFVYGDSVFEVMRRYPAGVFAQTRHLERLGRSAARLGIPLPCSLARLGAEVEGALSELDAQDAKVRVVITRGAGPLALDPETASAPARLVVAEPYTPMAEELYRRGVAVVSRPGGAHPASAVAGAKASNYLANMFSVVQARAEGAHEAILVGPNGELREGATSNVFLVRGGRLWTPRLEAGILAGITRDVVLELADRAGVAVVQDVLFPSDLYRAQEAFITSSLREVLPVVRADGAPIGDGAVGGITAGLLRAYRTLASSADLDWRGAKALLD